METDFFTLQEDHQSDSDKESFCSKFAADQAKELRRTNHKIPHHESFHHQRLVRTSGITPQKKVIKIKKLAEPPLLKAHAGRTPRKPLNRENSRQTTPRMPKLTRAVATPVKGRASISPDQLPARRKSHGRSIRHKWKSPREEGEITSDDSSSDDIIEVLSPKRKSGQVRIKTVRTIVRK